MAFSLRLTADLTFALAARFLSARRDHSPILRVSTESTLDSASVLFSTTGQQPLHNPSQTVAGLSRNHAPIIWISGSEPLDHPEVALLSNALAASGRHVFLETSGASLKRHLHEFQPSSRFYFTIRFDKSEPSYDQRRAPHSAFRMGLEAIRMARLAGFFTCAHLVLHSNGAVRGVEELHSEICDFDVDGCLITPAAPIPGLEKKVGQVRRRLLNRHWALFSSLLEASASPVKSQTSLETERQHIPESQPSSFGESAEAG
jgi:hypothetical protein